MNARMRSFLFSIQTKMVLAIAAVIVLAIFLSGVVFVFRTREERREQALDRVAAASPAISTYRGENGWTIEYWRSRGNGEPAGSRDHTNK